MIHRGDDPVGGPAAGKTMRWRWPLTVLVVVVMAFVGLTAWLFVWPASATPERADAVVVFAGGRGERLRAAMRLIRDGVAPTLVISNGWDPGWTDANRLCRGWSQATVLCPTPDPDTTEGEARMVAALAERSGWRSMVLVTSSTTSGARAGCSGAAMRAASRRSPRVRGRPSRWSRPSPTNGSACPRPWREGNAAETGP
jgi:hypothetical protein